MALQHSPSIVTNGLVLYLDAANRKSYPGSGNTIIDLTNNNNNGTFNGGVSYSSLNNGSLYVNGSQWISINDNSSLNQNTATTISTWVYFAPIELGSRIIYMGKGGGQSPIDTQYWLEKNLSDKVNIYFGISGVDRNMALSGTTIVANTWYNIVSTYDGTTMKGFVNGVQDITTISITGTINSTNKILSLGQLGTYAGARLTGNIGNTSIYNRALSAAEIQQNFNALRGRYGI